MASDLCPCCGQPRPSYYEEVARLAKLTALQSRLFLVLAKNRNTDASWRTIFNACYFDDLDGGPLNTKRSVHVTRCYANKKLARFGLQISSAYGVGYRLEAIDAEVAS